VSWLDTCIRPGIARSAIPSGCRSTNHRGTGRGKNQGQLTVFWLDIWPMHHLTNVLYIDMTLQTLGWTQCINNLSEIHRQKKTNHSALRASKPRCTCVCDRCCVCFPLCQYGGRVTKRSHVTVTYVRPQEFHETSTKLNSFVKESAGSEGWAGMYDCQSAWWGRGRYAFASISHIWTSNNVQKYHASGNPLFFSVVFMKIKK